MIAAKAFTFHGRAVAPGDALDVRPIESIALRRSKRAVLAPTKTAEPPAPAPTSGTESRSIEDVLTDEDREHLDHETAAESEPAPRRRRRYQRRDLTPEP